MIWVAHLIDKKPLKIHRVTVIIDQQTLVKAILVDMLFRNPISSAFFLTLVVNDPIVHEAINGTLNPPAIDLSPDTAVDITNCRSRIPL